MLTILANISTGPFLSFYFSRFIILSSTSINLRMPFSMLKKNNNRAPQCLQWIDEGDDNGEPFFNNNQNEIRTILANILMATIRFGRVAILRGSLKSGHDEIRWVSRIIDKCKLLKTLIVQQYSPLHTHISLPSIDRFLTRFVQYNDNSAYPLCHVDRTRPIVDANTINSWVLRAPL